MSLAPLLEHPTLPDLAAAALRVGDPAPDAELYLGGRPTRLHRWSDDAWAVLFLLPEGDALDRAAELRRLGALLPDFRARFVKLLGIAARPWSVPGEAPMPFAVAVDPEGELAQRYGLTAAARSVAVIDPEHRVRLALGYPPQRERDFADVLRLITALQQADARRRAGRTDWRALQGATLGAW